MFFTEVDMKVKDTLEVDKIYSTLHNKVLNFIHGTNHRYTGSFEAIEYIQRNFTSVLCTPLITEDYQMINPDILAWCEQNFENDWVWNWSRIYFKNPHDKVLFLLKWS
jgi:hypothetical protein